MTAVFSGGKLDRYISKIKDGRDVSVSIIHTDPKEAYTGALRRGSESGRFVPISYMMQACKEYADLNENVEKKFVSIDKIRNLVRAGKDITEIPKRQPIDINYRITRDELQIIYENYSQLNTLTDEQRKRIEGERGWTLEKLKKSDLLWAQAAKEASENLKNGIYPKSKLEDYGKDWTPEEIAESIARTKNFRLTKNNNL